MEGKRGWVSIDDGDEMYLASPPSLPPQSLYIIRIPVTHAPGTGGRNEDEGTGGGSECY